jgi:hypothetical protein
VIEVAETESCWAVLATSPAGGIPPGDAFLVDKFSGRVFPRRLVDVEQALGRPRANAAHLARFLDEEIAGTLRS